MKCLRLVVTLLIDGFLSDLLLGVLVVIFLGLGLDPGWFGLSVLACAGVLLIAKLVVAASEVPMPRACAHCAGPPRHALDACHDCGSLLPVHRRPPDCRCDSCARRTGALPP